VLSTPPVDWAWWRVFGDPTLDELVVTAHEQNLTLREIGFRVMEARNARAIAIGGLFPQQQTAFGAYSRRQLSLGTGLPAGGGAGFPGIARNFSVWNTGVQLAWEVDFWGRFRRAIEAADADLDAQVEGYDAALVLLISDVADAYIEIRTLEKRLEYANANVENQLKSLKFAEDRLAGGITSRTDVAQARSNVAQTRALIPGIAFLLRQAENRLCVLLGMPPREMEILLGGKAKIPEAPIEVAVGIPADLLRRRPDVRQAERQVAAQSARIGIAETDLYPAITINGTLLVQANQFRDLFRTRSIGGNFGPSFNWNILNYGRIRHAIEVEEARFMQELTQYQNLVLLANREAEDSIYGFLQAQEEYKARQESVAAALDARNLVVLLRDEGKVDYNRLFIAELFLTQQQDLLATAQGAIAQNLVLIHRALGGGWELRLNGPPQGEVPLPLVQPQVEEVPPLRQPEPPQPPQ
jgi:NodT family efflux transporter outer membrane factor (OMF) lipoprotein